MCRITNDGRSTADLALRLNQVRLVKPGAAILALIATGLSEFAVGARSFDVPVRKEHVVFLAVKLLFRLLSQDATLVKI